jgi:hypothetical protein
VCCRPLLLFLGFFFFWSLYCLLLRLLIILLITPYIIVLSCLKAISLTLWYLQTLRFTKSRGGSRGGVPGARPPPPKIRKNIIFWRKIVIFHTKYSKYFRASLRSAQFFLSAPPP